MEPAEWGERKETGSHDVVWKSFQWASMLPWKLPVKEVIQGSNSHQKVMQLGW